MHVNQTNKVNNSTYPKEKGTEEINQPTKGTAVGTTRVLVVLFTYSNRT